MDGRDNWEKWKEVNRVSLSLSLSLSLSSKMKSYAVLNKASGRSKQEADQVLS
jgi:hypothetical protein